MTESSYQKKPGIDKINLPSSISGEQITSVEGLIKKITELGNRFVTLQYTLINTNEKLECRSKILKIAKFLDDYETSKSSKRRLLDLQLLKCVQNINSEEPLKDQLMKVVSAIINEEPIAQNQEPLDALKAQAILNHHFPISPTAQEFGLQTRDGSIIQSGIGGEFVKHGINLEYLNGTLVILSSLGYYNPDTQSFSEDFNYHRGVDNHNTFRETAYTIMYLNNHNTLLLDAFKTGNRGFLIDVSSSIWKDLIPNSQNSNLDLSQIAKAIYLYRKEELNELEGVTSFEHKSGWQEVVLDLLNSNVKVDEEAQTNKTSKQRSSEKIIVDFKRIIAIIRETKKVPSQNSQDIEIKKLATTWFNWKRKDYQNLPKELHNELESCIKILKAEKELNQLQVIINFKKIIQIIKNTKNVPSTVSQDEEIKKLGQLWISWRGVKSHKNLPAEIVAELKECLEILKSEETVIQNQLIIDFKKIVQVIKNTKKAPSADSQDEEVKKLGLLWYGWKIGERYQNLPPELNAELEECLKTLKNQKISDQHQVITNFKKIVQIIKDTKKSPSTVSEDDETKTLSSLWRSWKRGFSYKNLPPELTAELEGCRQIIENNKKPKK